jgi:hypothetical protein
MEGEATGDVVVFGGSAEVDGPVRGDVALFGGSLKLGPRAHVAGDLAVIGGSIDQHPDAVVEGEVVQNLPLGFDWRNFGRGRVSEHMANGAGALSPFTRIIKRVFHKAFFLAGLALLAMLVVLVAQRPLMRTAERIRHEPAKSGLVGLAVEILILPVTVLVVLLLCVSIIGIPLLLLVPIALLGAVLVALLGYCAALYRLGDSLQERFRWGLTSPYVIVLIGLAVLGSFGIAGALLHFGWMNAFAALLIAIGALANYAAWTLGLGAAVLEWIDARRQPAGAIPPAPEPRLDEGFAAEPLDER